MYTITSIIALLYNSNFGLSDNTKTQVRVAELQWILDEEHFGSNFIVFPVFSLKKDMVTLDIISIIKEFKRKHI